MSLAANKTDLMIQGFVRNKREAANAGFWAGRCGVAFCYEDFREGWQQNIDESIRLGLYRQAYCGCIYSEQERYDREWRRAERARQRAARLAAG